MCCSSAITAGPWCLAADTDNGGCDTPTLPRSGASSPYEQSFTSSRRRRRGSLDLVRPASAPQRGSLELACPHGGARRGLDLRFNAAVGSAPGGSPSALQRITEQPTQEGCTLQEEAAPGGTPVGLAIHAAATTDVVAELLAEAAAERQQELVARRQQHLAGLRELSPHACGSSGAGPNREASPEVEAQAVTAGGKPALLKLSAAAPSSQSPGSSPGIQAVHGSVRDLQALAVDAEEAEPEASGGLPPSPSPQRGPDACSVEPASLPSSPFASRAAQMQPPQRTSSDEPAPPCGLQGWTAPAGLQQQPLEPAPPAEQQQPLDIALHAEHRQPQTSEEDEGDGVYPCFDTYEEMVAHFHQVAAEGRAAQHDEAQAAAAHALADLCGASHLQRNSSSLAQRHDVGGDVAVTAASSFSGGQGRGVGGATMCTWGARW